MATALRLSLNEEQKSAFKAIAWFLEHPAADTFVLMGYAGTGKTYLMQGLANWLSSKEKNFSMLASTGRAAAVLRGKTGFKARTVHGELYHFQSVDGDDDAIPDDAPFDQFGQMRLMFELREPDEGKMVYIVDEASMLSDELSTDSSFAKFGTGYLLTDFFNAIGSNKVIFVGDPCQLPPVGMSYSPALDMGWLVAAKRTAMQFTLAEIVRQKKESPILKLAAYIRYLTTVKNLPQYPKILLPPKDETMVSAHILLYPTNEGLLKAYLNKFKQVGIAGCIAVVRTNRAAAEINSVVRRNMHNADHASLQVGDILMVTQNNYVVPLANGDFVIVRSIGELKTKANLHFLSVRVEALLTETEHEIMVSLDILYSGQVNFSAEQHKSIMIDFSRRMRQKNIRPKTVAYKAAMFQDSYLNCLRATYGYAVTCHKAQGGEWNEVFLFLDKGMYRLPRPELLRWWYTSITRAREYLHLENAWWIEQVQ